MTVNAQGEIDRYSDLHLASRPAPAYCRSSQERVLPYPDDNAAIEDRGHSERAETQPWALRRAQARTDPTEPVRGEPEAEPDRSVEARKTSHHWQSLFWA
jgi:hypothetical protein